jgi:carboxyl-terminal processing protease
MRTPTTLSLALLSFAVLAFPAAAGATGVSAALRGADSAVVSRGDFVRAAVEVFGLPADDASPVEGQRVPDSLLPYVNTALDHNAMDGFRGRWQLGRGITRGEALVVLKSLLGLESRGLMTAVDMPAVGPLNGAIGVALERDWVEVKDDGTIGVDEVLTGKEARLLLRKANGEGGMELELPDDVNVVPLPRANLKSRELPEEEMLRTVWQILVNHYVDEEKLDPEEAAYRAAEAMVDSVKDPYTTFMRPVQANDFNAQLEGTLSGIGAQVEQRDGDIVVIAPLDGSPAAAAGIQAGDVIATADGIELHGLGFLEAIGKIRGPQGTSVRLTVKRGETTLEFTVTRQILTVPEVGLSWQGTVAVIKLAQFGDTTSRDFRRTVADAMKKDPTGLILDLRNNPGGYLDAADVVLSAFLPQGSTVVHIRARDGDSDELTDGKPIVPEDLGVVVLVNKGSASASEIVAGALQDDKRATIVGETTFGKGTVQNLIPLADGSNLKVTTARWYTPLDRAIQDVGVTPDVTVAASAGGRDEQMLKAIELLR